MPDAVDPPPIDVAACLERVRRRDQQAARELVEHLYPLVVRIVRAHLPRRVAEEDLCQEVFLKMFSRLAQYQGAVPFTHWVSRIAVTTCIDHLRAQRRRPEFRWADLSENESQMLDAVLTSENEVAANEALAAKVAQEMGLKPVAHVGGGFTAWREAGGAIEKVEPKKSAGEKQDKKP